MTATWTFNPEVCKPHANGIPVIIRAKTPVRISFAGGGTDFPHWFHERHGAVLCSTISHYARVTLYPREDREVFIRSVDLGYMVNYNVDEGPVFNGMLDLAKAAIRRLGCRRGMDLDIQCDAPPGSGLGGSSALVSSVIGAVAEYDGQTLDHYELAQLNYEVERNDLKIPGGVQDQYGTTFGGFNHIEFSKDSVLVNPLRLNENVLADLEAHLMMCYLGKVRISGGLIDKQIQNAVERKPGTIEAMERIYTLVHEMKSALLKGNLALFGDLLHEGFVNKKLMNPGVTAGTPADRLYDLARQHGASGGKLMGAGGGGYLLLYCPTHRKFDVRTALENAGGIVTNCSLEPKGLQVWRTRCL